MLLHRKVQENKLFLEEVVMRLHVSRKKYLQYKNYSV